MKKFRLLTIWFVSFCCGIICLKMGPDNRRKIALDPLFVLNTIEFRVRILKKRNSSSSQTN